MTDGGDGKDRLPELVHGEAPLVMCLLDHVGPAHSAGARLQDDGVGEDRVNVTTVDEYFPHSQVKECLLLPLIRFQAVAEARKP